MKRLVCYAHFDDKGELKPFVKHSIAQMKEVCHTIAFVSNSILSDSDINYLNNICDYVKINDNVGYDFYMWKTALNAINYKGYDEVILMNSSVFGPLYGIGPMLYEMSYRKCDFWGMTECFQIRPHIQSYFLVFKKPVVESDAFALFWNCVMPYHNKHLVVLKYEIGLSQWLIESGFMAEAYFSFVKIGDYCRKNKIKLRVKDNYSVEHAVELLAMGNPFLKVDPIRKNSINLPSVHAHLEANGYPFEYLELGVRNDNCCPICGSHGKIYYKNLKDRLNLYNTGRYTYYRCRNRSCGTLWIYPAPSEADIEFFYHNYYTNIESVCHNAGSTKPLMPIVLVLSLLKLVGKMLGFYRRRRSYYLHELDKVRPGKLLEVGCGSGDRLIKLRQLGWDVVGQEVDKNALIKLRENNIDTVEGPLESNNLACNQFDIILLSHVIEHVTDPKKLLSECLQLLKQNGRVVLSTPNFDSMNHFLFKKYWLGIDAPRHFFIFNNKALTSTLSSLGYGQIKATTVSLNTELFAMHSIDILLRKWTYLLSGPRIGKELIPMLLQVAGYIINKITGKFGDECFVIAAKK